MSSALRLPADIEAAVSARWPDTGPSWCAVVEDELHHLCRAYKARPVSVFPARYGFIVESVTERGPLIMRASPDPNGMAQGRVGMALAGIGVAPFIHELRDTETGTWTVMDRVVPGTPIVELEQDYSLVDALVALFRALCEQPAPVPGTSSLSDWLRSRLEPGEELTDLAPGRCPAEPDERRRALVILDDLETDLRHGLCHGDASPWNVLASGEGRLVLVDPRGVGGEIEYDLAVVAQKAAPAIDPVTLASHVARRADLVLERVTAWLAVADAARV